MWIRTEIGDGGSGDADRHREMKIGIAIRDPMWAMLII